MERSQGNARRTPHQTSESGNLSQIAGGESRKSRNPFAVARLKPSTNLRRNVFLKRCARSKKTKLKGRRRCIAHSIWNNMAFEGMSYTSNTSSPARMMTTSENEGDLMVEKTSTRAFRLLSAGPKKIVRIQTRRDRRTWSRDRSKSGSNDRGLCPVYDQLDSVDRLMLKLRTESIICGEP